MNLAVASLRLAGAVCLAFTAVAPASGANPAAAPSAQGEDGNGAAPAPTGAEKAAEPRKICRRIEATESRMKPQRICMTKEEWKRVKL
jgi:hypothetical protein